MNIKKSILLFICIIYCLSNIKGADDYTSLSLTTSTLIEQHGTHSTHQFLADVNGDGKDDAVIIDHNNWYVALSDGSKFLGPTDGASWIPFRWLQNFGSGADKLFLADVNKDYMADAIVYYHTTKTINNSVFYAGSWHVALSNGGGFDEPKEWIRSHGIGSTNQFVADVNNDNRADAIVFFKGAEGSERGDWYVAYSNGTGNFYNPHGSSSWVPWITAHGKFSDAQFMGDVNRDGNADAIIYEHGTVTNGVGDKGTWYVALSKPENKIFDPTPALIDNIHWTPWVRDHGNGSTHHMIADVDGDGMADAVAYSKTSRNGHIARSNGFDKFVRNFMWSSNGSTADTIMIGKPTGNAMSFVEFTKETGAWKVATPKFVPVYFEVSEVGWDEVEVHAWYGDAKKYEEFIVAEKLEVKHATEVWHKAYIPVFANQDIKIQGKKKSAVDYTVEMSAPNSAAAYTVHAAKNGNNRTYSPSPELTTSRKFIYTEQADNSLSYTKRVTIDTDTISYFTTTDVKTYAFCHGNDIHGYTEVALPKETSNGVYYAPIAGTATPTTKPYTSDYYIRTDGVTGGWNDYKDAAHAMTYFAPQDGYTDKDRYYWVKWLTHESVGCKDGKLNVKGAVANEYNDYLAETDSWDLTSQTGGANVRFGYDPSTNTLRRTRLAGSDVPRFLIVHGDGIYADATTGTSTTETDAVTFTDLGNFVYKADIYTLPAKAATVQYAHNGDTEKPIMTVNGVNHADLNGGFEGTDPSTYRHHLRLYYDYKTDRVSSAWIPTEVIPAGAKIENYPLCTSRSGNGAATNVVSLETTATVNDAVFELHITQADVDAHGGYFWFSLPFACNISDIRGVNATYGAVDNGGSGDWAIQRYRGDKRTADGSLADGVTYWRYLNQTATLEANRGYVLQVKTDANLFPATFFFPSAEPITLSSNPELQVPQHSTSANSKTDHTNWNLIGSGALRDMKAHAWAADGKTRTAVQSAFYTWSWEKPGYGVYLLTNAEDTPMGATQAYFVQFGGTIHTTPFVTTPAPLAPRRVSAENAIYAMRMEISNGEQTDKTYIILDETATDAYDVNLDLGKIVNNGLPQIYTMCANSKLASNNLPIAENQSISVGVKAAVAGDYTFSMPRVDAGVIPMFYDMETGDVVNLSLDDYTVYLEAGTYETRFVLKMNMPGIATDVEEVENAFDVTQVGNELIISGIEGEVDIRLYDMLGREIYHSTNPHAAIPVTQTGVYVLQVNGAAQRIVVK